MMESWGPDLFTVDKQSSVPIYVQIAERVQALVTVGTLRPGDRLPSIRAVSEHLRVDYNTVARAYTELDRAGLIKTARGVGTHVTDHVDEDAIHTARQAKLHSMLSTTIRALRELGYTRDEIIDEFRACTDEPSIAGS
jgi:GntR family transcriptional regulator